MIALTNTMSYQHASNNWLFAMGVALVTIACMVPVFRFQPQGHRYRKTSRRLGWWFFSIAMAVLAWVIMFGSASPDGSDALQSPNSLGSWLMMVTSWVIYVLPVLVFGLGLCVLVEWPTVKPQRRRRRGASRLSVVVPHETTGRHDLLPTPKK